MLGVNNAGTITQNGIAALRTSNAQTGGTACTFVGNTYNSTNTATRVMAVGTYACFKNTGGVDNAGIGSSAMYNNTTGFRNVANGTYALFQNQVGHSNSVIGYYACGRGATPYSSAAVGIQALEYSTTTGNTGVGGYAGQYIAGGRENTAVGYQALRGASGAKITGRYNTAIGGQCAKTLYSGDYNLIMGYGIEPDSTTADYQLNIGNAIKGIMTSGEATSLTLNTVADGALLANQPTGGADLAIATTKYVNEKATATKVADYTLTPADYSITADGSSADVAVSTPASPKAGQMYNVACLDSTNIVEVDFNGKNFYDSSANQRLFKGENLRLIYDGTQWVSN